MRMDQFYYLIDIAKTHSISTTAQKVFSSQQAVSNAINKMEKELGRTLLNRSKTGVTLTADGELVVQYALEIVEKYQTLLEKFEETKPDQVPAVKGSLNVCVAPVIANTILPQVIRRCNQAYPQINLFIQDSEVVDTIHMVSEGLSEIGIISIYGDDTNPLNQFIQRATNPHLHFQQLFTDQLVACVHQSCNLALKKSITQQELFGYKQTSYASISDYPAIKNQNTLLFVSSNTDLHKKFIAQEKAVCQMPHQAFCALFAEKEFVALPIPDSLPIIVYVLYLDNAPCPPPVCSFIKVLQEVSNQLTTE